MLTKKIKDSNECFSFFFLEKSDVSKNSSEFIESREGKQVLDKMCSILIQTCFNKYDNGAVIDPKMESGLGLHFDLNEISHTVYEQYVLRYVKFFSCSYEDEDGKINFLFRGIKNYSDYLIIFKWTPNQNIEPFAIIKKNFLIHIDSNFINLLTPTA